MNHSLRTACALLPVLCTSLAFPLQAFEQHAHQHGHAELDLALEHQTLSLSLSSPLANLVGFEHQPNTQQQLDKLTQAISTLKQGKQLFELPVAAGCTLHSFNIEIPFELAVTGSDNDGHDHGHDHDDHDHGHDHDDHDHGHDHDDHDHGHDHDDHGHGHDHDDHGHGHDHDDHGHGHDDHDHGHDHDKHGHADLYASWQFGCLHPGVLESFDTRLFQSFPGMESVALQAITEQGQSGQTLNASQVTIQLP